MARPIEPTPPVTGEDADRLLEQILHGGCSKEESEKRIKWATAELDKILGRTVRNESTAEQT